MNAATSMPPASTSADAHHDFAASLGRIEVAIRHHFRRWPHHAREEAMAEAVAYTWAAWLGLIRRGRDPVAVGVVAIAANCCLAVRNGRSVASSRRAGRGAIDLYHPGARGGAGPRFVPLEELESLPPGAWRDWLASGSRYGPAEEAAFRVDFATWLEGLPERKRRVAELLAQGLGTGVAARRLGVTPGAVSQSREWLEKSWDRFQGEAGAPS